MPSPFLMKLADWTWWLWLATAVLLTLGVATARPAWTLAAAGVVVLQLALVLLRSRRPGFALQLRLAYLLVLALTLLPGMAVLAWLPMLGTWALVVFGYCLLARMLALLPWNRSEALGLGYLQRVFFSRPDPVKGAAVERESGCGGGMCSIVAQVG